MKTTWKILNSEEKIKNNKYLKWIMNLKKSETAPTFIFMRERDKNMKYLNLFVKDKMKLMSFYTNSDS